MLDRNRGGAYLAVGIAGAGMFGVFLFLTYYLQQTLGFSPIQTGLAFLPMIGRDHGHGDDREHRCCCRASAPRPLVDDRACCSPPAAMLCLTGLERRLDATRARPARRCSSWASGFGLIFAPAMQHARRSASTPRDAGVASAMVNTSQQVGGSIGTALLSTLAASAATSFVADARARARRSPRGGGARLHDRVLVVGGDLPVGALVCGLLLRPGVARRSTGASRPRALVPAFGSTHGSGGRRNPHVLPNTGTASPATSAALRP